MKWFTAQYFLLEAIQQMQPNGTNIVAKLRSESRCITEYHNNAVNKLLDDFCGHIMCNAKCWVKSYYSYVINVLQKIEWSSWL